MLSHGVAKRSTPWYNRGMAAHTKASTPQPQSRPTKKVAIIATPAEKRLIQQINRRLTTDPEDYLWIEDQFEKRWGEHLPKTRWNRWENVKKKCVLSYEQASQVRRIAKCPGFLKIVELLPTHNSVIESFQMMNANPNAYSWFAQELLNGKLDKHLVVPVLREIKTYGKPLAMIHEERRQAALADPEFSSGNGIITGDFRELHKTLREPVDLFISDPPWAKDKVPLFGEYAKVAEAELKPSGWCLAFAGIDYLPEIITLMGQHLTYYTAYAINYIRRMPTHYVTNSSGDWCILLVYYKPPLEKQPHIVRSIQAAKCIEGVPDTLHHPHGKSVEVVRYYMDHFSMPGDLVVDCFVGGGVVCRGCKVVCTAVYWD